MPARKTKWEDPIWIKTQTNGPGMGYLRAEQGRRSLLFFLGIFPKKCIIELCGGGGTADTHASGACAHSGVRVQIPFSASWKGGPARYGTGLEIRQVDFFHARVQIPSFPYDTKKSLEQKSFNSKKATDLPLLFWY